MREIKFRAWDGGKMAGNLGMGSVRFYEHNAGGFYDGKNTTPMAWEKVVFMQYTGLKDKNGVEIYEGDICRHHYFKATGQISYVNAAFKLLYTDAERDDLLPIDMKWFEVIGNIHENPELLK